VQIGQRAGVERRVRLLLGRDAPAQDRVDPGLDGQPRRQFGVGLRPRRQRLQDRHRIAGAAEQPRQVRGPQRRPVVTVGAIAGADLREHVLRPVAAAEQDHRHRAQRGGLGRTGFGCGSGEPVGRVRIEERQLVAGGLEVELRVGRQIGLQGEQCAPDRRLHVSVGLFAEPAGQLPAQAGQVHLAGGRPAQFAVERVCQPGGQPRRRPLDVDQPHLLGRLEVAALRQIAKHVDVQRLALREQVDHEGRSGGEAAELAADHVGDALGDGHIAIPHPHPGHLADAARRHLVLEQLQQIQRVPAGELPEPPRRAAVHRPLQGLLDQGAGRLGRQRLEVEPREQPVLPQRGHRVRLLRAGAHRHHQPHTGRLRELVHDVRGQAVEQVGVVDADQYPAVAMLWHK
jgi:hypothetical protein